MRTGRRPRRCSARRSARTSSARSRAHRRRARRSSPCHQGLRYTYAELGEAVDRAAARAARRRARAGRPRRHLEPELRRVGARPVRHRQASGSSSSTSTRPTGPPSWSTRCASPAAGCWSPRRRSRPRDYVAMVDGGARRRCPSSSGSSSSARRVGRARRRRRARRPTRCSHAPGRDRSSTTRSTSSTRAARPASPRARRSSHHNILNNGYFVGEGCRYTERGPRLHPGALLPLLRHGDGQPRLHHPRRLHGHPGGRVRARGRRSQAVAGRALHGALRRADDVHRRARAPATSPSSTSSTCAPGSWPARRARSRSCARSSTACTWRR